MGCVSSDEKRDPNPVCTSTIHGGSDEEHKCANNGKTKDRRKSPCSNNRGNAHKDTDNDSYVQPERDSENDNNFKPESDTDNDSFLEPKMKLQRKRRRKFTDE